MSEILNNFFGILKSTYETIIAYYPSNTSYNVYESDINDNINDINIEHQHTYYNNENPITFSKPNGYKNINS